MLCISVWTATHLELQFLVLFCIVHTNHLRNVLEITEVLLRTACTEFRGRVLWPVDLFSEEQQMALLQTADQTAPQHLQHHAFYIYSRRENKLSTMTKVAKHEESRVEYIHTCIYICIIARCE